MIYFLRASFFLVCAFAFLRFWPESLFSVWVIFLVFFLLLLLFLLLCCIVPLKELVYLLFIYFFENRLVPTLFLILCCGYQPERVKAGVYLLFYTLLASLPLLFGILFVYNSLGSLCLFLLCGNHSLIGGARQLLNSVARTVPTF